MTDKEQQIYDKWKPILDKFNFTEEKAKNIAQYAEAHSLAMNNTEPKFSDFRIPLSFQVIKKIAEVDIFGISKKE